MRLALRHRPVRTVVVLLSAGLVATGVTAVTAVSASAAAVTAGGLPSGCTWDLHRLPVPAGQNDFRVRSGIDGTYVGDGSAANGGRRPLVWTDDTVTEIGSPGDTDATADGVNKHGVVIANDQYNYRPYLWEDGQVELLALPDGATSGFATAINDAGTIVGYAIVDGTGHGLVWSARTPDEFVDLGTGDGFLYLRDIDNAGTIVGETAPDSEYTTRRGLKGTVWGGLRPLTGLDDTQISYATQVNGPHVLGAGVLPGSTEFNQVIWDGDDASAPPTGIAPSGVNRSGLIVGTGSKTFNGVATGQATVLDGETITRLPNLLPTGYSRSSDVTDDGTVIGWSQSANTELGEDLPVTWTCS